MAVGLAWDAQATSYDLLKSTGLLLKLRDFACPVLL